MRCYFLWDGHIAGVEMLPLGLSDEDAIARAHTLSSNRKGPFDGFEVWDRARCVFRLPPPPREKDWRAAGQKATFRFSRALCRDPYKNEVRRGSRRLFLATVPFRHADDNVA
jgi:hypothetical protein